MYDFITANAQMDPEDWGGTRLDRHHANSDKSASGRAKRESGPLSPGGGGGKPVNW